VVWKTNKELMMVSEVQKAYNIKCEWWIWKDIKGTVLQDYPSISQEGMREFTTNLSRNSWSLCPESNLEPPKYEEWELLICDIQ